MNQSPISGRRAALLVGFCAFAMLALTVLYAFAPDLRNQTSDEANALSRSAVGFAGLQQLLTASGIPTRIDRGDKGEAQPSLTILTPPGLMRGADLTAYVPDSPVLIVLDKWQTTSLPLHDGWVNRAGDYPTSVLRSQAASAAVTVSMVRADDTRAVSTAAGPAALPGLSPPRLGRIDRLQTLLGPPAVLTTPNGGILLARSRLQLPLRGRRYPVYILSDPDLLNNHGLSDPANAAAAIAIISALRAGNGPVATDVTLNGLGKSPSLLRAAFAPPFLGATICALLAALLMGLHAAIRFGPASFAPRIFARGKLALADNSAALVKMMGREAAMAPRYVAGVRNLVLERLGARRIAPAQQQALLDTLTKGGESYEQLLSEASGARTGGDLLTVARKTFAWQRRISGGH